jgi:hypothetical protein
MLESAKLRDLFCLGRSEAAHWFLPFDYEPLSPPSTRLRYITKSSGVVACIIDYY